MEGRRSALRSASIQSPEWDKRLQTLRHLYGYFVSIWLAARETGLESPSEIKFGNVKVDLKVCPFVPGWVLEGNPVSRNFTLSSSKDGYASTVVWDCTAGRFNWFYAFDESLYILEGSVLIKDEAGAVHDLSAGDTIFFPLGARAEWTVPTYVRKVAFCRNPLPPPIHFANRVYGRLRRTFGLAPSAAPLLGAD